MRALGQASKDPDLVNYATEFKLRCERRLGEMLAGMKEKGEISKGNPLKVGTPRQLKDLRIDRNLLSRAQRIASIPEEKFEAVIGQLKQDEHQITRKAIQALTSEAQKLNEASTGLHPWYPSFLQRNPPKHPPSLFELRRVRPSHSSMGLRPWSSAKADKATGSFPIKSPMPNINLKANSTAGSPLSPDPSPVAS